jgi:hypothetical protein
MSRLTNHVIYALNSYEEWRNADNVNSCTWIARGVVFVGASLYVGPNYLLTRKEAGILGVSTFLGYCATTYVVKNFFPKSEFFDYFAKQWFPPLVTMIVVPQCKLSIHNHPNRGFLIGSAIASAVKISGIAECIAYLVDSW